MTAKDDDDRPLLCTADAAVYCGFKTLSALRKAKMLGKITPAGRRGGTGTLMWDRRELDRFLRGDAPPTEPEPEPEAPPKPAPTSKEEDPLVELRRVAIEGPTRKPAPPPPQRGAPPNKKR